MFQVEDVVVSGATGKGIAVNDQTDSDIIVFVRKLPLQVFTFLFQNVVQNSKSKFSNLMRNVKNSKLGPFLSF